MLKVLIDEKDNQVRHYLLMTQEQYDVLCYLQRNGLLNVDSFDILEDEIFHTIEKSDDYA